VVVAACGDVRASLPVPWSLTARRTKFQSGARAPRWAVAWRWRAFRFFCHPWGRRYHSDL